PAQPLCEDVRERRKAVRVTVDNLTDEQRDLSPHAYLCARLAATAVALWLVHRGLIAIVPAGDDIPAHVVRTDHAFSELFARGRLDGWFWGFGSGYRLFAVNGPGLPLLVGLTRVVFLGQITTAE